MCKTSIHSDYETKYYNFTQNAKVWSLPTISVYASKNTNYIQEVTINFDDHSYTKKMYELYEKMCFYTLKVFLSDLKNEQIINLYKTLNNVAYDNVFPHDQGYNKDSIPHALYYKGNIGIYSYFAIGECVHFCIIPVTNDTISYYKKKRVNIHEIK